MGTSKPQDRDGMGPAQKSAYDAARDLANRTQSGEDILANAGQRLSPVDTADLAIETTALTSGARYLVKFIGQNATDVAFIAQTDANAVVDADNTCYPIQHGESLYVRVPKTVATGANPRNAITCLFPNAGSFLNVIQSDERGEEDALI